jgi:preprotein translocase subunit SecF
MNTIHIAVKILQLLLFVCNIFYFVYNPFHVEIDRIGCIVVSVPTASTVDRVFYPRLGQTKVY